MFSNFRQEDVSVTMYPEEVGKKQAITDANKNKVDSVCDAMRQALQKIDRNRYENNCRFLIVLIN